MSSKKIRKNNVNRTGTVISEGVVFGMNSVGELCRSGCHQTTAGRKWTKEEKKKAVLCYSNAWGEGNRGYIQKIHQEWKNRGMFQIMEKHLEKQ